MGLTICFPYSSHSGFKSKHGVFIVNGLDVHWKGHAIDHVFTSQAYS